MPWWLLQQQLSRPGSNCSFISKTQAQSGSPICSCSIDISTGVNVSQVHFLHKCKEQEQEPLPAIIILAAPCGMLKLLPARPSKHLSWLKVATWRSFAHSGFLLLHVISTFPGSSALPHSQRVCVYFCWNKLYLNFRCLWLCFFVHHFGIILFFIPCNVWNSIIQQIYMSGAAWAALHATKGFYWRRAEGRRGGKTQPTLSYNIYAI